MENTQKFKYLIIILLFIKLVLSYYTPVNMLYAPHDDFLYLRIAENIANFKWLGEYDTLLLIKGVGYPIFLALTIIFNFPIRLLETLLQIFVILHFNKTIFGNNIYNIKSGFIIIFLVFCPFQYVSNDYRILRDMIYPWILIYIISLTVRVFKNDSQEFKKIYVNYFILATTLYYFSVIREEGVWVVPFFIYMVGIFLLQNKNNLKKLKINLYGIFLSIAIFGACSLFQSSINYIYYGSPIKNEFKEGGFTELFAQIWRLRNNNIFPPTMSEEDWKLLFSVSPAANEMEEYYKSEHWDGWAKISCDALKTQGIIHNDFDCKRNVIGGWIIFPLKDASWIIGYKSSKSQDLYWKKIAYDIQKYCEKRENSCRKKADYFLTPETLSVLGLIHLAKNLIPAYYVAISPNPQTMVQLYGSGEPTWRDEQLRKISAIRPQEKSINNLIFNEIEYLKNNNDVNEAVKNKQFETGYEHFIKFGYYENRIPGSKNYSLNDENWIIEKVVKLNIILSKIYSSILIYTFPVILIFAMLINCMKKNKILIILMTGATILLFTRISLVSLLNYTGMLPIVPVYMYSATVLILYLFCLSVVSIIKDKNS